MMKPPPSNQQAWEIYQILTKNKEQQYQYYSKEEERVQKECYWEAIIVIGNLCSDIMGKYGPFTQEDSQ